MSVRAVLRLLVPLVLMLLATRASAETIPVKFMESATYGFLVLRSNRGEVLAHGELIQVPRGENIESRLVFRFLDGSLYDEIATFTQKRVFRLVAYKLIQKGPSFSEPSEVSFDRASGRYRAQTGNDEPIEGPLEMPEDLYNGMTSTLLRNLSPGATANAHTYAFTPKPRLLRSTMRPEGEDKYFVGDSSRTATRYLVTMEIGGLTGVIASVLGKDPPDLRFWISTGGAPAFLRFQGAMYLKGPVWRIDLAAPRWPDR